MTTEQADTMIKKLDTLIDIMSHRERESEYTRTSGALRILRRTNPAVLSYVRNHFMRESEWKRDGKYYEYMIDALKRIRTSADKGEIIIPK